MTYIKLFIGYLDAVEELSDDERGRLFTALLQYARTGEAPRLSGNERFVFPMMRAQLDRDAESYEELTSKRSAAGKRSAQVKANKAPSSLTSRNPLRWAASEEASYIPFPAPAFGFCRKLHYGSSFFLSPSKPAVLGFRRRNGRSFAAPP